jgi:hypothetical protein
MNMRDEKLSGSKSDLIDITRVTEFSGGTKELKIIDSLLYYENIRRRQIFKRTKTLAPAAEGLAKGKIGLFVKS